ncbi:hypothetical protein EMIHUDRAFT_196240 [Emiliania huxleyi CCMP1516]|uniref:Secreted protein n=2 Tax=Emiliania huxleyi TaxID=2903 RepID=A0A0D3J3Q7_EMIH1|nr:hypothetical protein EMIHUDRAFT_196240 [Emiliania huxleyi CCMP1516]EOD18142.1 hypothetical protein EMIHUDRAFT_196240 [Emiliania huxleyi CCMP1516]|eukprot:XP_005770571.1 hypothetical protein EMIHUDRAFT_196240 [Emiliania huxleyi CCMP1516]
MCAWVALIRHLLEVRAEAAVSALLAAGEQRSLTRLQQEKPRGTALRTRPAARPKLALLSGEPRFALRRSVWRLNGRSWVERRDAMRGVRRVILFKSHKNNSATLPCTSATAIAAAGPKSKHGRGGRNEGNRR